MTRIKIALATLGTLGTMGVAAPAFAHEGGYYDDHGVYHQELEAQHDADHAELDAQHDQFHAYNDAAYAQQMQACGWNQACRWLVQRRFARRHNLEHLRENLEHLNEHQQLDREHEVYHDVTPGASYSYAPTRDYVAPRVWLRFGR